MPMRFKCLACNPPDSAAHESVVMSGFCVSGSQYILVCPICGAKPVYIEPGDSQFFDTEQQAVKWGREQLK